MQKIFSIIILYILIYSAPINANTVLDSQRILTQLGFKPGSIHVSYGKKKKKALQNFYISIGQKYDGSLDMNELIDLKKAIKISGVKNVCSSSVNLEKTEGISKRYIDADFNSYFAKSIITDLPRFESRTDGTLIPKLAKGFGSAEIKLIADFNNDNFDDIMIENYNTNIPPIFLMSKGNGEFEIRNNLSNTASRRHIRKAVAADFNNDGLLDVAGFTTGDAYKEKRWPRGEQDILLINEGGKTFREVKIPEWTRNEWNHGGGAADIDGDGLVDILPVAEEPDQRTGPIKNFGNNVFKKGKVSYSKIVVKEASSSVMTGDLNKDGHVDLVFAITKSPNSSTGFRGKDLKTNTIQVIYGDGDFNFKDNKRISFGHHWLTPDEVKQMRKNHKKFRTASNPHSIKPTMGYKFQGGTSNVELVDVNRDGLLDIVAGYIFSGGSLQMSSGFKVYINQGNCFDDQTETFFPNQRINRETEPGTQTAYIHRFYFKDISGDKLPDLVLQMDGFMDFLSSEEPYHPNIFINNGSNVYLPLLKKNGPRLNFETYKPGWTDTKRRFEETLKTHYHSVGDFDGDGRADFVFIKKSGYSSNLHVLLQRTPKEKEIEKARIASLRKTIIGDYNVSFTLETPQKTNVANGKLEITSDSLELNVLVYNPYSQSNLKFMDWKIIDGNILDLKADGLSVDNFGECLTMKGMIKENAVFKNVIDERGPDSSNDCRNKQKLWPISMKIEKIDYEAIREANRLKLKKDALKKLNEVQRQAKIKANKIEAIREASRLKLKKNAKKLKEVQRQAKIQADKKEKKLQEEKLKLEALQKEISDIVPVSFKKVYVKVSKREGNYQGVFVELFGLTVGSEEYKSFGFNLMIDYAEKSSSRDLTKLFRIQVPADGLIPEFALPNLEECKKIAWKTTNNGITITFLIGNESERNLCVLRTMYPEKRNFLGSIAYALSDILESGLAGDQEQLEAILHLLKDAKQQEL